MNSSPPPEVSALPAPPVGSPRSALGSETFDNRGIPRADERTQRAISIVGGVGGALVLVVGLLLLTVFPLGLPDPTFGQRVGVPAALLVLGGAFLAISVVGRRGSRGITEVAIDDAQVELRFDRGAVSTFRWDDPKLEISLSRVVQTPPRDSNAGAAWVLDRRGGGLLASPLVTLEVGEALTRRAHLAGLETTTLRRELGKGGGIDRFEGTILAPPGKARLPGPDWHPVVIPPAGTEGPESAPPTPAPPPTGPPQAVSPRKPPKVPHC